MTPTQLNQEQFKLMKQEWEKKFTENKTLRKEQANMRSHLQQWHKLFFKLDNGEDPMQVLADMSDLYLVNPYDDQVEEEWRKG